MPKTLTEVTQAAAELSGPERLKLARILLELSEADSDSPPDVQDSWNKEIERRLQELRSGKVRGVPLQKVKEKIERRFCS